MKSTAYHIPANQIAMFVSNNQRRFTTIAQQTLQLHEPSAQYVKSERDGDTRRLPQFLRKY